MAFFNLGWNSLIKVGVVIAIAYLAISLALYFYQNRLIFVPSPLLQNVPGDFNLRHEDVWLPVGNNPTQAIHGWWIPAEGKEVGAVLHLHGNGHNVGANLSQAIRFHWLGLSVLLIDYRGYGLSKGNFPTEASVYIDATTAWNYLTQTRQIPAEKILLFGHSLGGAIAIDLAVNHANAAGLIVQSSFTSMRAMVDRMGQFWMFPIDLILTQRFDSIRKVPSLKLPVLYAHGTADELIPFTMSEALHAASPEPKRLILVPGADHNNVPEVGGETYLETLREFVDRVL
jgi:fermentation-respiration switch protein FrsA (DUF1100 family)